MPNKEFAEELHKPIFRKVKNRKVYSSFKDDLWGVDQKDMQLVSKYFGKICFLIMCYRCF